MKLALDLTHCSHSSAQTGIQQVARGLWNALAEQTDLRTIVFDKYADYWRLVDKRELDHLHSIDNRRNVKRKRPHWSSWQRIRGRLQKRFGIYRPGLSDTCEAALIPEFFAEWVGPRLPDLDRLVTGPKVAVFHDAIAFQHPDWGVPSTIERYPQYLSELSSMEAVACVSEYSRKQLVDALDRIGAQPPTVVRVIPLGLRTRHLDHPPVPQTSGPQDPVTFLTVATVEPRKNHLALLEAAEALWKSGFSFRLILVGMLNRGNGRPIETVIRRLQSEGRPIQWMGSVAASELATLYQSVDATVFPSHCEGFGLPVLESLYFNKPCLASNGGALEEVVPGGGTLMAPPTPEGMRTQLQAFLESEDLRVRLTREATERQVRTMKDYAADILALVEKVREDWLLKQH